MRGHPMFKGMSQSPLHLKITTKCKSLVILYLAAFLAVGEVAVSGEPAGSEGLAWIWMLWTLNTNNTVP